MVYKIVTVSDSDVGKEVVDSAASVLNAIGRKFGKEFEFEGYDIDEKKVALPEGIIKKAKSAHAVLLGSLSDNSAALNGATLLDLRKALGLYAELRPVKIYPALIGNSALKDEIAQGVDLVIVREQAGGIYFGEHGFGNNPTFGREAYDVERYSELEIERVARVAYELAQTRARRLTLVDKADKLTSSKLWRKIVADVNEDYPFVRVDMLCVDDAATRLALNPSQFDVLLTSNMFGDILLGIASALVGGIGVMPSASLGETTLGIYGATRAHSAMGKNIGDPIGAILSAAMMLRHSLDMADGAECIERAVERALSDDCLTRDLGRELTVAEMTKAVVDRL